MVDGDILWAGRFRPRPETGEDIEEYLVGHPPKNLIPKSFRCRLEVRTATLR
jgi:hypothetical protein